MIEVKIHIAYHCTPSTLSLVERLVMVEAMVDTLGMVANFCTLHHHFVGVLLSLLNLSSPEFWRAFL